ncbi:hypothetical protein Tco_1535605 [Tanacetum coccineum]
MSSEHKAYWALKHANFDLETAGDHRKVQLNELNELRDHAYENSLIYKEKTKRIYDAKSFIIAHVFPYGTVELSQNSGPNFKVNGHRIKHYFGEDIPKLVILDLQTFPKDKRVVGGLSRIFEASRARDFCPSITRASNPQLHLGNLIS